MGKKRLQKNRNEFLYDKVVAITEKGMQEVGITAVALDESYTSPAAQTIINLVYRMMAAYLASPNLVAGGLETGLLLGVVVGDWDSLL